ncbi:MAG: T9SS type A sorting domain-containing protein [Lishizhenia sp.]
MNYFFSICFVLVVSSTFSQVDYFYEVGPYLANGEKYYTGKVQTLEVSPNNDSVLYAGSPSGGLWKSTNAGDNWILLNDNLPLAGVSSIQISEVDTDLLYISCGDKFHKDQLSQGVFKSTDGGLSWQNTTWTNTTETTDIALSKLNANLLFIASVNGLEKSTDGGGSASNVISNDTIYSVQIHPINENLVFACSKSTFYRSSDGGNTFQANTALNVDYDLQKIEFDVSKINPNEVALVGVSTNNHLDFVLKSTDFGSTFQEISNTFGGQAYTEKPSGLAVKFDNFDSTAIYLGKIDCWKAEEIVSDVYSFDQKSQWFVNPTDSTFLPPYIHDFVITNQFIYTATDGGVYRYDKTNQIWENRNNELHVYQSLNFDLNPQAIVSSAATVPSFIQFLSSKYSFYSAVDAILKEINGFPHAVFISEEGKLRSLDLTSLAPAISEDMATTNKKGCLLNRDIEPDAFYVGLNQIYKYDVTINSQTPLTNLVNQNIKKIQSNFTNADFFYFSTDSLLFYTDNNFNSIQTVPLPYSGIVKSFDVFNTPNHTIVLAIENGASDEVLISSNFGVNWTNVSNGILEDKITTVFADTDNDRIFVGTTKSLYAKALDFTTSFSTFNQNLPKTAITEINVINDQVWVSTFGRGVWTSDYNFSTINEEQTPDITLYPNPSLGFLYITQANSVHKISIYNAVGKLVLTDNNPSEKLDIRCLEKGTYFLKCTTDFGEVRKKIVKY